MYLETQRAPFSPGLYAAANAADGNGSTANDYIYSTSATLSRSTGINDLAGEILPESFSMKSYPNPFNASVNIAYSLEQGGQTTLSIYDLTGRLVNQLVSGDIPAGDHFASWTGLDTSGQPVSSGMYLVRLNSQQKTIADRIVMLK